MNLGVSLNLNVYDCLFQEMVTSSSSPGFLCWGEPAPRACDPIVCRWHLPITCSKLKKTQWTVDVQYYRSLHLQLPSLDQYPGSLPNLCNYINLQLSLNYNGLQCLPLTYGYSTKFTLAVQRQQRWLHISLPEIRTYLST